MATTTRKTPQDRRPKKTTASSRRSNGVVFDLDALEREGDVRPPFKFKHGGQVFTLSDPAEIDLQDIIEIGTNPLGNPVLMLRLLGDQYDDVVAAGPLPQWQLIPMIQAWMDHYGLAEPGKSDG